MLTPIINPVIAYSTVYDLLPKDFTDRFGSMEQKWFDNYLPVYKDTIFHGGFAVVDQDFKDHFLAHNAFAIIKEFNIRRVSFDIGPRFRKYRIKNGKYVGIGNHLSRKDIFNIADEKIGWLREHIPEFCGIALENPSYYATGAYDEICEPELYNDLCQQLGIGIVFDLAHAQVSAHNLGVEFDHYVNRFDKEAFVEAHLSKCAISDEGEAIDTHLAPDNIEFQALKHILKDTTHSVDVVIEFWDHAETVVEGYKQLEMVFPHE